MPIGWTAIQKVRASGKSAGTVDTIYHSPDGLTKCRSLVEVYRHLESQKSQSTLHVTNSGHAKKRKKSANGQRQASEGQVTPSNGSSSEGAKPSKKRKKLIAKKSLKE